MTAICVPSGDQARDVTSTPAGVRARASGGRGSFAGRPRRGTGRVDDPDLRPAASARDESESLPVGRPAGRVRARLVAGDLHEPRPVGLDDPDLVVADEREAAAVGRPLRVADGLLRGGQLGRVAAAQGQGEQLPTPGGLRRVGDGPVPRMEPELTGRLDRDDRLDRQAVFGRSRSRGGTSGAPPGSGQSTVAHHGPIIARCLRTWPYRQS